MNLMNPHGSDQVTRGIRIVVEPAFQAQHSNMKDGAFFWTYTITIKNEGTETVQLVARHWVITNGEGVVEEVKGEGVVGQQPVLEPGDSFSYTSGCPLTTPKGRMHGSYQMVTTGGEAFDVVIAPFLLESDIVYH